MARTPGKDTQHKVMAMLWRRLQEGGFILLTALALFLFVALISYQSADPGWSKAAMQKNIINAAGKTGAFFSDLFFYLFGYIAYMFPLMIAYGGFRLFQHRFEVGYFHRLLWTLRCIGFIAAIITGCGLASLHFQGWDLTLPAGAGGILGAVVASYLIPSLGSPGCTLLLLATFLAGTTLTTGLSWFGVMDKLRQHCTQAILRLYASAPQLLNKLKICIDKLSGGQKLNLDSRVSPSFADDARTAKKSKGILCLPTLGSAGTKENEQKRRIENKTDNRTDRSGSNRSTNIITVTPTIIHEKKANFKGVNVGSDEDDSLYNEGSEQSSRKHKNIARVATLISTADHALPKVDLLEANKESEKARGFSTTKLESLSREVEARLLEFGVQVVVVGVYPGPVITRFELELAAGIKVSKITGLSKDLARALSVSRVRVVEVIPGKSVVGLEIPNEERELVRLREIIESEQYNDSSSHLTMALGKDISGEPVAVNLAKMPHLLVAGTTGSGKSVGVNVMLLSLLYKATPEDVRLILIDPKMLELSIYDGIPHLLTPVVTDMKDAANALRWCVGEMERRYQVMAALGVRNIIGYNRKILDAENEGNPIFHPLWKPELGGECPLLQRLPYIVVIIDEFADMIMVVGKKVEELIARIAQKARAAGIHMILATQRPSVDVITGLIKANVPTRIAFQVSSRIDSRTILDQQGAEQLLGHGDMLYLPPGSGIPIRIHGAFVSDEEVHAVVKALKQLGEPDYAEDILGGGSAFLGAGSSSYGNVGDGFESDEDELYEQAVQVVKESRRSSISHLQRRLKIGYNRAARLIETMETRGVVSPMQSNGNREILGYSSGD